MSYKKPSGHDQDEIILSAIEDSHGIMSVVAKRLKVTWNTARDWVNSKPIYKQAFKNEEEIVLDEADKGLYKAIILGDIGAIKWIQSTKGRSRGYGIKHEIEYTQKAEEAINILVEVARKFIPAKNREAFINAVDAEFEELDGMQVKLVKELE